MLRYLPLLFFFVACAGDPLDVDIVDLKSVTADDGFTVVAEPYNQVIPSHEELTVKLSFRGDAESQAMLALQSRYVLNLPSLTIGDLSPSSSIDITEGVWQDLEVQFIPEKNGQPAILVV